MNPCTNPQGHDWRPVSFTSSAGSTPVACANEGCHEIGYRLDHHIVPADRGNENDEGLF